MSIRLNKAIKEFNVGLQTIVDFLGKKGYKINAVPSEKIDDKQYELLKEEFGADKMLRNKAEELLQNRQKDKRPAAKEQKPEPQVVETTVPEEMKPQIVTKGKIDLDNLGGEPKPAAKEEPAAKPEPAAEQAAPAPQQPEEPKAPEQPAAKEEKAEEPAAPAPEQPEAQETPAKPAEQAQPQTDEPAKQHKERKPRPSVEERAKAIGEESDGVFKLHTQAEITAPKVLGTIDLSSINATTRPKKKSKEERRKERESKNGQATGEKKKRQRIGKERVDVNAAANQASAAGNNGNRKRQGEKAASAAAGKESGKKQRERNRKAKEVKAEVTEEDVAKQVKETLARLTNKQKGNKGAKFRKEKREQARAQQEEERLEAKAESKILKLTEFVTANELANMMQVPVTKVIGTCMSIGIMVSINQRMDAETIDLVAEEFGFKTEFVSADVQEAIAEEADNEEDLEPRAPIVTVMGHVDHGKTSLLDYIRKSNVIAGEAGGITQHIGAYNVTLENGRHITFLDTPGHEAFTAMRARGAQVTDIAIIIIAADDDIMPQTKEAISHAVAANVPIVFAINKIDKPHANPDKIKEGLAAMNFLVEEWGGKYQSQDISAKKGIGVSDLL
ncbi:MAG: translation initiation factor IF-2 N-terminal domain-containing protein, partial [Bacteroidales bacterium]|nr:translation initiation factor IF-2 N-terminal domain-containing protein [Bacteroidales bacterium]